MMPRYLIAAALLGALATPALAQSQLERLEAATEAASANMASFMIERVPDLADVMFDWEWDEELRAVGTCTIDAIRAEAGDDAVETYITEMEAFSSVEITSLAQMGEDTPVPVNAEFAQATGLACGGAEVSMRRMQESGMMAAMMDPAVMERLMAPE